MERVRTKNEAFYFFTIKHGNYSNMCGLLKNQYQIILHKVPDSNKSTLNVLLYITSEVKTWNRR